MMQDTGSLGLDSHYEFCRFASARQVLDRDGLRLFNREFVHAFSIYAHDIAHVTMRSEKDES